LSGLKKCEAIFFERSKSIPINIGTAGCGGEGNKLTIANIKRKAAERND
jgi:hypothetical protein